MEGCSFIFCCSCCCYACCSCQCCCHFVVRVETMLLFVCLCICIEVKLRLAIISGACHHCCLWTFSCSSSVLSTPVHYSSVRFSPVQFIFSEEHKTHAGMIFVFHLLLLLSLTCWQLVIGNVILFFYFFLSAAANDTFVACHSFNFMLWLLCVVSLQAPEVLLSGFFVF